MSGITTLVRSSPDGRRAARRAASKAEILEAAWGIAREGGLAQLSMRELGDRVGMRAQSLYSYFANKDAIYDAMFRQACAEQLAALGFDDGDEGIDDPALIRAMAHRFFEFCTSDPVRYQLLFQRTIPGFEPSPDSYASAVEVLARTEETLRRAGIADQESIDLALSLITGLAGQQLANEPSGRRWARLVDRAVDLILKDVPADPTTATT